MRVQWLCKILSILFVSGVYADSAFAGDLDEDLVDSINMNIGSAESVQNNLLDPMINGGEMTTLDGLKTFNQEAQCKNSAAFLEVLALPSASGDISQLNIRQDKDWDGVFDSLTTLTTPISGVCANGVISCDIGTWDNCQAHTWVMTSSGSPALTQVALSKLGGCYCINQSCGQALMLQNGGEVLGHIGSGIVSTLVANTPTLIVADSYATDANITYLGGLSDQCDMDGATDQAKFYNDPDALKLAASSTATLDSLFTSVTTGAAASGSATTTHSCTTNRTVTMDDAQADDIILYDGGSGGMTSCGSGCLQIVLGTIGDNYWNGGTCGLFKHEANFWVERPDRILSATLLKAKFDDHIQIASNDQLIWAHESSWTDLSDISYPPSTIWSGATPTCERWTDWDVEPNVDFTNALKQVGAHKFSIRVAVSDKGEGYAYARVMVDEQCQLMPDSIEDTCSTYASDSKCNLMWESIDGITTIDNYSPTGLVPLPTTKTIQGSTCSESATRTWWSRKRSYNCQTDTSPDFTGILDRKQRVSSSASLTGYDDLRLDKDTNTWEDHDNNSLDFPTPPPVPLCEKTCKTRVKVEPDEVAGMGPESSQLTVPESFEFRYHTCTPDDECPIDTGEEIISACACKDYFMDATLQMQVGRLAGREAVCTSGVPSPL